MEADMIIMGDLIMVTMVGTIGDIMVDTMEVDPIMETTAGVDTIVETMPVDIIVETTAEADPIAETMAVDIGVETLVVDMGDRWVKIR
jgi:hypothetical protein